MKKITLIFAVVLAIVSACNQDDMEQKPTTDFTLTIENVTVPKVFFNSGTTTGIAPGTSFSFTFHAGKRHYLSLATMLAQSNDLFYAFSDMGLALYDSNGDAVVGDVTDQVILWDAGTEVNEEPGTGPNQAPRQTGPDTGAEEDGTIRMISEIDDGFTYPSAADIISVVVTHKEKTEFTVTLTNNSDMAALSSPLAPGVWVVHSAENPLFEKSTAASDMLEKLAEDGHNSDLGDYLMMNSGFVSPFAPGVYAVYSTLNPIFESGNAAPAPLEALAEDGDPTGFNFEAVDAVREWGVFVTPTTGNGPAPIFPGEKYEIIFSASPGEMFGFATMLVQSNDLFVSPASINLYSNGQPVSGDITNQLKLWDAKTEVNEYPGAGMNQAPRQDAANTGDEENGAVEEVNDGFSYPDIADMAKVTIAHN